MARNPPPDLSLAANKGPARTVRQWLTTFHLVFVALDPATDESSWILPTAERILYAFREADCRVAWLVTADGQEAARFLGPRYGHFLTFADSERTAVQGFGLERLPALVHVGTDGSLVGAAEGWDPDQWRAVVQRLAKMMAWIPPAVPGPDDPPPFEGSPALP